MLNEVARWAREHRRGPVEGVLAEGHDSEELIDWASTPTSSRSGRAAAARCARWCSARSAGP
jgi:hypothetical protein